MIYLTLAASKQEDPLFIILDEIEDPHNLGSIMRTADAVVHMELLFRKEEQLD